jgi:TolA-binding protein
MAKLRIIRRLLPFIMVFFLGSGCVYFNTFFNAKKKFNEAEKTQEKNREGQQNTTGLNRSGGGTAGRYMPGGSGRGQQSQSQVTPQVRLLYEDAIKKASKVLKFHPESRYVDDALWLIGKAYFNMGDYLLADRKFQELVINHPESKYADDSYFYSGLCQVELGNEDLANKAFAKVESLFPKSGYIDDIYFARGKIDKNAGNCTASIDQFKGYIEKFSHGDSAAKAVFLMGQCKEQEEDYYDAYLTYSRVKDYGPDKDLYFDATLASAVAALNADSLQIGMKILDDLAKNEKYFQYSSQIHLKIAEGHYLQGDIEKAIEEYENVTVQNPKTEESAEAYYHLGLIYQNSLFDIAKAKEAFSKAQNESSTSEYRNLALSKSAQIAKLESYRVELQRADSLLLAEQNPTSDSLSTVITPTPDSDLVVQTPDSLSDGQGAIDTSGAGEAIDDNPETSETIRRLRDMAGSMPDTTNVNQSQFIGPLPQEDSITFSADSIGRSDNPEVTEAGLNPDSLKAYEDSVETARRDSARQEIIKSGIETRFLLAELYAYELNRPDSALTEYLLLAREYPESPYAARSLLAAANIEFGREHTDSGNALLQRIIDEHPQSPQAVRAAEMLDYPLNLSNNALGLYARAESLIYYANDPDSAIAIFRYLSENFPDMAAKADFAVAWTLEYIKNVTDSSAYYAYTSVKDRYPQTEYAEAAKYELGLVSRVDQSRRERREKQKERQQGEQDLGKPAVNTDSLRRLAMELPSAPRVVTQGEFLYPEELLDKDLKGQVIFKIRLDITGRVQDYEIIGPSGEQAIDSVATTALLETEFDTSNLDFTQLDSFFKYSIPFERPEIDLFNDPYREQREREHR